MPASAANMAAVLALLASAIIVIVTATPYTVRSNAEMNRETVEAGSVDEYYRKSAVKKFAQEHSDQMLQASKEREYECGAIKKWSKWDCDACLVFVEGLKILAEQGGTQEDIVKFTTKACIELKIEDVRVCQAITVEFKDELFGVITKLVLSPNEACGLLIDGCGDPYDPFSLWNITLPGTPKPPIVPPTPPAPTAPKLRLLHLTDIHLDPQYTPGRNAECGEPLCCRANDGPPAPGVSGAGKYGDYRACDLPVITMDSLFKHLNSMIDEFDYVIFTGDIPAHNVWNQSRADQLQSLDLITSYFLKYLPDKVVYSALGNHESAPVNSFPPPFITGNQSESWLYNAIQQAWAHYLPSSTFDTIQKGGFYTITPFPGLRIISLNMNFCQSGNWWLLIDSTDPAGMLQWLIQQLQDAENKGDKVYILGHVYPGACMKAFSWNYYKIINRYESTVVEQFFGHTHDSYFEMFYDDIVFMRPLNVVYLPGSVTTYSHNLNPGFRIYELDGNYAGTSWKVIDYTNYYMNLTDANLTNDPKWQVEYSAREEYGMETLFPKDWNDLIYRMKTDDALFEKFCIHYSKSGPNKCSTCTGDCRKHKLCELKSGRSGDADLCKDL